MVGYGMVVGDTGGGTRLLPVLVSVKIICPKPLLSIYPTADHPHNPTITKCCGVVHSSLIPSVINHDIHFNFVKEWLLPRWLIFEFSRKLWQNVNCDSQCQWSNTIFIQSHGSEFSRKFFKKFEKENINLLTNIIKFTKKTWISLSWAWTRITLIWF